jgi:hypothetical protein
MAAVWGMEFSRTASLAAVVPATFTRTKPFTEFSGILAKSDGNLSGAA